MLFRRRFHGGIRNGSITRTFRAWSTPRVGVGRRYRIGGLGEIEVTAVERVALGGVGNAEARRAGFTDARDLAEFLRNSGRRRVTAASRVFRVDFRYRGETADPRERARVDVSPESLDLVAAKLAKMDARSDRGRWTLRLLRLIGKRPGTRAADLAAHLGRETPRLKADVRKLKAHGLTVSLEIGYDLSPRGRALLECSRGPRAERP